MSLFLDAARGGDTGRAPVWLMRQAGRYLPEYRRLRDRYGFAAMCQVPELAAEVTLQPLRRFELDAAILFSDIMTPLPAMGVEVSFDPGPVIAEPLRDAAAVDRLRVPEPEEVAPHVEAAIAMVRADSRVPLIGFAGAPLTLAAYLVQGAGSKDYAELRAFLWREPGAAGRLLDRLTDLTIAYLRRQVAAGAHAVQLFDSWAGLLDERSYAAFGLPYAVRVLKALAACGVPRIYLAVDACHLLDHLGRLPAEVIGVDWRTPLGAARSRLPGRTLQGNLDPAALFAPRPDLVAQVRRTLRAGQGGPHVFNLGHGVLPGTPIDAVSAVVDAVRAFERGRSC